MSPLPPRPGDLLVADGMRKQLSQRRQRLGTGEKPLGWKVGFGAAAAMDKLQLTAPLIGFMTDRSLLASGAAASLADWTKPVGEPELALYIAHDIDAPPTEAEALAAIGAIGPAIELADLDQPPEDIVSILSGNIYHRAVVLGPKDETHSGGRLEGLKAIVHCNDAEIAATSDLEANTGKIGFIVRHVATCLLEQGETLRAGEVIIAGSIVPPLFLDEQDSQIELTLRPGGNVSVQLTH